ncbi:MAG: J domain-containing protein [Pseudomonadales bacterium]|nr:J domain-containing protein [Pseudomonadales bacterium]
MNSKQDTDEFYLNLGLNPGSPWEDIRQSYKKLAQLNHPDRYKEGSREQEEALMRFKLIAEAYQALSEVFQEKVAEQDIEVQLSPVVTSNSEEELPKPTIKIAKKKHSPDTEVKPSSKLLRSPTHKTIGNALLVTTILGVIWFALHKSSEPAELNSEELQRIESIRLEAELKASRDKTNDTSLPQEILHSEPNHSPAKAIVTFTYGSTMTTVLAAQGTPTLNHGTIWIFGDSRVVFDKRGKVTDWQSHPNNPLNTSLK